MSETKRGFRDDERSTFEPDIAEVLDQAITAFTARQREDGAWPADYGGALFLIPIYVVAVRFTGYDLAPQDRDDLVRYLLGVQNDDGGWGLHADGPSFLFTTTLIYVSLRILELPVDHDSLRPALDWIKAHGGPGAIPTWGKFILALMNLYRWEGLHPILPELWLLPWSAPIHPGRLWCHCRMVYLPMSYLYGAKASVPVDDLVIDLREELWGKNHFVRVVWAAQRDNVAEVDRYMPRVLALDVVNQLQDRFERFAPPGLRKRAMREVLEQIRAEDENTNYIDIGPVNKMLNTIVWSVAAPGGVEVRRHHERIGDYLWLGPDGLRVQGYNNTHLWDVGFAAHAILAAPDGQKRYAESLRLVHRYVEANQVLEDVPRRERVYRDPSRGGWPFSDGDHGWPISDCTAEGLEAAIELAELAGEDRLSPERLRWAVELLLFFQNDDGGWASYEKRRASPLLEKLNPSEVFGAIMVDYSYVECTAACIRALATFRHHQPRVLGRDIGVAIRRGEQFIREAQRDDGGWFGSWAICFTYGTWFGIWGLRAAGVAPIDPAIRGARAFLLARQHDDGSWGESIEANLSREPHDVEGGDVVQTSWALLALMRGGCNDRAAIERGLRFLIDARRADGLWERAAMTGIFNNTCALNYDNYRFIFPIWALGLAQRYLSEGIA